MNIFSYNIQIFRRKPGARLNYCAPLRPLKAAPLRAKGPEQSNFILDVVIKLDCNYEKYRCKFFIHVRKRPFRPANAEIRPDYGYALS